jgi:DNA-binding transcriptional ArsR family regulator
LDSAKAPPVFFAVTVLTSPIYYVTYWLLMNPDSMNAVFEALASPARRKMLDIIKDRAGCSVNDVCGYFEFSRIAVMKHLGVLAKADLIVSRKEGRTRELYFNPVPIQMIYDRWTSDYSALWASGLTRIKYRIETALSSKKQTSRENSNRTKRKKHA